MPELRAASGMVSGFRSLVMAVLPLQPYSWKCAKCQIVLRQDLVRYFTLVLSVLIPLAVIAGVLASTGLELALLIVLIPFVPILWWSGSIKRREE
jgi:hypothetical protein